MIADKHTYRHTDRNTSRSNLFFLRHSISMIWRCVASLFQTVCCVFNYFHTILYLWSNVSLTRRILPGRYIADLCFSRTHAIESKFSHRAPLLAGAGGRQRCMGEWGLTTLCGCDPAAARCIFLRSILATLMAGGSPLQPTPACARTSHRDVSITMRGTSVPQTPCSTITTPWH